MDELPPTPAMDTVAVSACLSDLQAALHGRDADGVSSAIVRVVNHPQVPDGSLDGAARQAAIWMLQDHRWEPASRALTLLHEPTDQDAHLRNLAHNMAALFKHRPDVAKQIQSRLPDSPQSSEDPTAVLPTMRDDSAYRLFRDEIGTLRVVQRDDAGRYAVVPPAGQFAAFLKQTRDTLVGKEAEALGLLSVGDGAALTWLAEHPPTLFMDQSLCVHVFEPDVDRLLMAMHLHDWSRDGGPIRDARFVWHIGDDWERSYTATCTERPWIPMPMQAVCPDPTVAVTLGPSLKRASDAARLLWGDRNRDVLSRYAERDDAGLFALFTDHPPRTPRIAVLTSRFTTVLQYAARDTAAALNRLGWDARVFMESCPHERFSPAVLTALFDAFAPDAVFTIDTPRTFIESVVPPSVPVLFWIQDALPRLMNRGIGASTTPRDFVLTFFSPRLIHDHGYPARQCIDMPMMVTTPRPRKTQTGTHPPETADELSQAWASRTGPDLIYASNVSATPETLIQQTIAKGQGEAQHALETVARRMAAIYENGGNLATEPDIDALLESLVHEGAIAAHSPDIRRGLRDALWNPLNTGLYRQQALAWVADDVDANGGTLHVHGRGWSEHPRFAAYDRGPLDHAGLQAATADAKFALHLEPYICFTHHRMLDALQAGTPVLVRDHPGHFGLQRVAAFLHEHADAARCDRDVREALGENSETRAAYEALVGELRGVTWDLAGDVAAQVRAWQGAGVLPDATGAQPALPALEHVSFGNAAGFAAALDRLRNDRVAVGGLLLQQRAAVDARLTFDAALRRVLRQIHGLLITET
ncbi:MAG: hypothetical protein AAF328_03365 [Planctomycetota bacterium]